MENNKMTAVEWFAEQVEQHVFTFGTIQKSVIIKFKNQALQMEKEQKKQDYIMGHNLCRCVTDNTIEAEECFEQYYKQTYGK